MFLQRFPRIALKMPFKHPLRRLSAVSALLVLVSCSGNGTTDPGPDADPVITVSGVEDGETYQGAVIISITTSPGTWQATLNGQTFLGGAVATPGSYTLVVEGRNGTATSRKELRFEIVLGGASVLIVRMLDLGDNAAGGGGDAILLSDSSAAGLEHVLVDAGPAGTGASDPGFVQRRISDLGVDTLEVMILTHAHSDHYQGMSPVLNGTAVDTFVYNGQVRNLSGYQSVLSSANSRAGAVLIPSSVAAWTIGHGPEPTRLQVVPGLPDHLSTDTNDGSDLNEGSLGTSVIKGGFRMFMTGDGETDANRRWRTSFASLTQDLTALKVGHHGANDAVFDSGFSGSGTTWLSHTDPEVQLISANGNTHPRSAALSALLGQTSRTYCTNVHGEITVRVNPEGEYHVTVEKNAGSDCVPGSSATS